MMGFLLYGMQNFFASPVVLAALAAAVSITALAYMMGEFFSMPSIKAFSKLELKELGVTAVIILLCVILTIPNGPFDKVGQGLAPPPPTGTLPKTCQEWLDTHDATLMGNPVQGYYYDKGSYAIGQSDYFLGCRWGFMDLATGGQAYIHGGDSGVVLPRLVGAYRNMMFFEMLIGLLGSFSFGISVPIPDAPFILIDLGNVMFFTFFTPINESHTLLVDLVGTLISAFAGQKMLLNFIDLTMFEYFLPIGLVLRAFPFSRKTGSTIVAVVFAAYFVFPLTVLINWQMWNMVEEPPLCSDPAYRHVGQDCDVDSDCCTNVCRQDECQPVITNFDNYESTLQICAKTLADPTLNQKLSNVLEQEGKDERDYFIDLRYNQLPQNEPGSKTQVRLERDLEEQQRRKALDDNRLSEGVMSVISSPRYIMSWGLPMFESWVNDEAGIMALSLLFVVNSIIISLTLLKDFSLLIGGEPRLLGITKLV